MYCAIIGTKFITKQGEYMNITKMSLVAAVLISSSAMAFDNTKVSGDANLYYQTSDTTGNGELLDNSSSAADMSVNLNVTTDVLKTDSVAVSAGLGYTALTTLGLEGQLVNGVWGGAHTATVNGDGDVTNVDTISWVNEAWFAATAGKTTVKVGRMELDTPLAFTEKWSIEKNTFEAAVLINEDIADTTLVGAYIGRGNGNNNGTVVDQGAEFTNYSAEGKGAYAVGAINNSWKPLTAQAWFYDLVASANATWIQGDLDLSSVGAKGLTLGAQYTTQSAAIEDTNAVAAVVGYSVKDTVSAKLSYSVVDTNGNAGANTATGNQSKLYTEAWWNRSNVTQAGAQAINLTVEGAVSGIDLGAYITMIDHDAAKDVNDLNEYTLSASKSFGAVDAALVYIHTDKPETETTATPAGRAASQDNTVQVYLTANF